MQVIYLQSARRDIEWVDAYYTSTFPEGRANMRSQMYAAETLLEEHPHIGRKMLDHSGLRELQITKTSFAFVYRVANTHIEILRVWDQRRDPGALNLDI